MCISRRIPGDGWQCCRALVHHWSHEALNDSAGVNQDPHMQEKTMSRISQPADYLVSSVIAITLVSGMLF